MEKEIPSDIVLAPKGAPRDSRYDANLDFYYAIHDHSEEIEELAIQHYLTVHPESPRPEAHVDSGEMVVLTLLSTDSYIEGGETVVISLPGSGLKRERYKRKALRSLLYTY